jgi:hypothetical protein
MAWRSGGVQRTSLSPDTKVYLMVPIFILQCPRHFRQALVVPSYSIRHKVICEM